jgi:hypothetical protein
MDYSVHLYSSGLTGLSGSCLSPLSQLSRKILLVDFGPLEHQPRSPSRKASFDQFLRLDGDFRFVLSINCVEVWWRMIVGMEQWLYFRDICWCGAR